MRSWWPLLGLLLVLPPLAAAGSAESPEVTDPPGDVAAFGAPATPAFGWADLQAAWFEAEGESVRLHIRVGDAQGAPLQGEVGVTFRVGAEHWIAGYTAVPPVYAGGFLSRADPNGDVPRSESPEPRPATWKDGVVTVTFPMATVDPNGTHGRLEEPWAWSESRASNGEQYRLDRSATGHTFAWRLRQPEPLGPVTGAGADRAAPWPALAALAIPAMAAALRRRD